MSSTEKKQKTLKYSRHNGGDIVGDALSIDIEKNNQLRDIIDNQRLGGYDSTGNYYLENDIRDDLVKMRKYVDHSTMNDPLRNNHDVYYLFARLPEFNNIEFVLEIYNGVVSLNLVERVYREGGQYFDTYEENLTNFVVDKDKPLSYIFKVLNIRTTVDEGRVIDDNIENVLMRKIYLKAMSDRITEGSVKLEREAFEECIELLKSSGEYGEKVLRNFVEKLNDRQEVLEHKDTPSYNKALNDILVAAMEFCTDEKDLKKASNKQVYNKVKSTRNEKTLPCVAEARENTTPNIIKGRYFELTKKDVPINIVEEKFGALNKDTLISKAKHKDAPAPIKDVEVLTKEEVIAKVVDNKVGSRWDKGSESKDKHIDSKPKDEETKQEQPQVKKEDIPTVEAQPSAEIVKEVPKEENKTSKDAKTAMIEEKLKRAEQKIKELSEEKRAEGVKESKLEHPKEEVKKQKIVNTPVVIEEVDYQQEEVKSNDDVEVQSPEEYTVRQEPKESERFDNSEIRDILNRYTAINQDDKVKNESNSQEQKNIETNETPAVEETHENKKEVANETPSSNNNDLDVNANFNLGGNPESTIEQNAGPSQ